MTTDRVKIQKPEDIELRKELEKVDWSKFLQYGSVKVQIRNGEIGLITKEETFQ